MNIFIVVNKFILKCLAAIGLGNILCSIAFGCFQRKNYASAIFIYEALSNYIDKHPYARFHLGLIYFNTKNYDRALNNLLKYMETHPTNYEVPYDIGSTYLRTKNIPMAKQYFEKAFELNKNDIDSLYQLGLIAFEEKDITLAHSYFSRAKELVPNKIDFEYCLLRCKDLSCDYTNQEEIDAIINKYEELLPKKTMLADFYIESAYIYSLAKAGRIDDVISKATELLTTTTNQKYIIHKMLGLCYLIQQNYPNALTNLVEAENLIPQNSKTSINNVMSYYCHFDNDTEQSKCYRKLAETSGEDLYREEDLYII